MNNEKVPFVLLNDGHTMPQLGIGVWRASEAETEYSVSEALQTGYRLIDTAAMYQNEAAVGRAANASGLARSDIFITSKVWNSEQGYEKTLSACENSLIRLGLDYIDLYLIHWPTPAQHMYPETWRALTKLQRDGVVRSIGVSNFHQSHLQDLIMESSIIPAINQIEVHPDFQQTELRRFCHEHDIAVEAWSPLGQGGHILNNSTIVRIATTYNKTPAQVVLRWHIESGVIAIPKSVHSERIKQNFDIFDFQLTEADMQAMFTLDSGNRLGPNPDTMNSV